MSMKQIISICLFLFCSCSVAFVIPLKSTLRSHTAPSPSLLIISAMPGHTESQPMSTIEKSQKDVALMVVQSAILYLTIKTYVESIFSQYGGKQKSVFIEMPNGIKSQLIDTGIGKSAQLNDEIALAYKIFYNGLQVGDSGIVSVPYGSSSSSSVNEVPFSVFDDSVFFPSVKVGNRYKMVVPSVLVFGEAGLTPYVPPKADVVYDISVVKITTGS